MLYRVKSFREFFLSKKFQENEKKIMKMISETTEKSSKMVEYNDYLSLALLLVNYNPKKIFEIGTYLGITSEFMLALLPNSKVISIAYPERRFNILNNNKYNNSNLTKKMIGSKVSIKNRNRYVQLYGDSHKIDYTKFMTKYGRIDFVFIDGDHSYEGVAMDTQFALKIITKDGNIAWHDANPIKICDSVRIFLEKMNRAALATKDDYIGGIAFWNKYLEKYINSKVYNEKKI